VHFGGCKVIIGVHFRRHAPQNAFFPLLSHEKTSLHSWSRSLQEELRYQTILQKGPGKALVESSAGEHMHRHARNQASAARPPIRLHLSDEEERAHSHASTPTKEMRGIDGEHQSGVHMTCTKKMRDRGSPPALLPELAELPALEAPVDALLYEGESAGVRDTTITAMSGMNKARTHPPCWRPPTLQC
jgi:hypothetical protein